MSSLESKHILDIKDKQIRNNLHISLKEHEHKHRPESERFEELRELKVTEDMIEYPKRDEYGKSEE